jgi:hypothetical protein
MLLRELCQYPFSDAVEAGSDNDVFSRVVKFGLGELRAINKEEKRLEQ